MSGLLEKGWAVEGRAVWLWLGSSVVGAAVALRVVGAELVVKRGHQEHLERTESVA